MLRRDTFDYIQSFCEQKISDGNFNLDLRCVSDLLHELSVQQRRGEDQTSLRKGETKAASNDDLGEVDVGHGGGEKNDGHAPCEEDSSNTSPTTGLDVDFDVVDSIFRSCYKTYMKAHGKRMRIDSQAARHHLATWRGKPLRGKKPSTQLSIFELAMQCRVPPMRMAKAILHALDRDSQDRDRQKPSTQFNESAGGSSAAFSHRSSSSSNNNNNKRKSAGKKPLKLEDHTLLLASDPRLRRDVEECVAKDRFEGPDCELERQSVGQEFEFILQEKLRNLQIPFQLEGHLREQGLVATPDTLLVVPALVHNPLTGQAHVVNWIESKAMFGDFSQHCDNFAQLEKYVERYGSGMVVYWFGYVEGLNAPNTEDQPWDEHVLVVSALPADLRASASHAEKGHKGTRRLRGDVVVAS